MDSPAYKPKANINSVEDLATILGFTLRELNNLSLSAKKYYHPNPAEEKEGGGVRQTYSVSSPLSEVQHKIMEYIFYDVYFPAYLLGGIKDVENPRDYVKNAIRHAKNKIFIKEDIRDFFPSIRASLVRRIWESFFCFPVDVCIVLTNLTTYKGSVPQGASTSPHLANLVFWDKEPELEDILSQRHCAYTRYFDDITISSNRKVLRAEQQNITEMVYGMFFSKGFRPKRTKRKVMTPQKAVQIHHLNVNSGRPTLNKKERSKIRKAVYDCELSASTGVESEAYEKQYNSVRGQVAHLQRFHPNEADQYINRLDLIKPKKPIS